MAEIAIGNERGGEKRGALTARAMPPEGWTTLLLHVLVISITANSVLRVEQGARTGMLIPLAIGGLLLGYLVARTPALDAISHFLALVTGAGLSLLFCAVRNEGISAVWQTHGRNVYRLAERLITAQVQMQPSRLPDDDLLVVIGITLWLVGYSSAWMLYRRRWLAPALVVPATLIFVSLRFEDAEPTGSLAAFAVASLIMAARNHAFVRQLEWSRAHVPSPRTLSRRFTASGSAIAVVALLAGWVLPFQAPNTWVDELASRVDSGWTQFSDRWNQLAGRAKGDGFASGIYTTFSDSFKIGGEFTPSPDPVASLSAAKPTYLALRRYDLYNGQGWASDVDSTFRMDGEGKSVTATSVTFVPNQSVALSGEVTEARDRESGDVTVLKDKGGLLFTTDTFLGASTRTVAVLGWNQLTRQEIDVKNVDLGSVPVDLQALVKSLREAEFTVDPATSSPQVAEPQLADDVEREQVRLLSYPITTSLEFNEKGDVILVVTGRLPNYDDIEAVYANQAGKGPARYRVIGSVSIAGEADLQGAGSDYPDWVTQRYLQLPSTVTAETVQLAADVVAEAGATTPFDKAWAIQEHLRNNYQYALNSEAAPSDGDAVDFFLFHKKTGRCEDYATAMVVMLRTQGIPARLVAGYRAGNERNAAGDFIYREEQAHTWVEAFFPGYGWIPFEPTSGQAPFDYDGANASPPVPAVTTPEAIDPTPTPEPTVESTAEATPAAPAASTNPVDGPSSWSDRLSGGAGVISLGLTLLAALIVGVLAAVWAWGLRGLRPGAALYAKAIRLGRLWGIEPHATMTPNEFAIEFGQTVPRAQRAVSVVAELYSAEQYGGVEVTEEARSGGQQAWHALRSAVLSWRPWRRRSGR